MQPKPSPPPIPASLGRDALVWLERHGLTPSIPTIRSSDWELSANPFQYWLSRRMGLIPALSYSKALSRGSWFHLLFALFNNPDRERIYAQALASRTAELRETCKALGIQGDKVLDVVDREHLDANTALSWYKATEMVPFSRRDDGPKITFQKYLSLPYWRHLGSEIRLVFAHPEYQETTLVAQLDLVLLNTKTNTLWIVDAKTCDCKPLIRLASVHNEFQTQHYMTIVHRLLETGELQKKLSLPPQTRLGGMIHVAVQKPSLHFGTRDRDYWWASLGKRKKVEGRVVKAPDDESYYAEWWPIEDPTAPHEHFPGSFEDCIQVLHEQTGKKPEKVYYGEPQLKNFVARCLSWYEDEQATDEDDPPVNMTKTSASNLKIPMWCDTYERRLDRLYRLATCNPAPDSFPMMMNGVRSFKKLSPYADFYLTPPQQWPEVAARNNFVIRRRDEDIEGSMETSIDINPVTGV